MGTIATYNLNHAQHTAHGAGKHAKILVMVMVQHSYHHSLSGSTTISFTGHVATSYRLDGPGFPSQQRQEIFSKTAQTGSGGPPNLFNGCRGSFPGVKRPGVKLTTHFCLVVRLKMSGAIPLHPIRLHGVTRDYFTM